MVVELRAMRRTLDLKAPASKGSPSPSPSATSASITQHAEHKPNSATPVRKTHGAFGLSTTNTNINETEPLLPYPPPTITESLGLIEPDHSLAPQHTSRRNVLTQKLRMNSQGELVNGTQQLSQSVYETIIQRSKSTSVPEGLDDEFEGEAREGDGQYPETQHTLNEGDEGHIDITSSFVTNHEPVGELADSDPPEFSPTQSQQRLTQFPESQRFKTPATAGKKRYYNGDTVETSVRPVNPLAHTNVPTPSRMMGLSQAFAGTQAASSPFSAGLPTVPRSDRPSPNLEMQIRATAVSSSPLRPISDFRRAATEPASRYVPMIQSQAERERLANVQRDDAAEEESDVFEDESSLTRRRRREKEREQRIRDQMQAASSPLSPITKRGGAMSSPPIPRDRDVEMALLEEEETASPDIDRTKNDHDQQSEVETEQEEDAVNVLRSSQAPRRGEEDKENTLSYVTDTVVQLQRAINGSISQVEASPCIRQSSNIPVRQEPQSSEHFRIADSQPSQRFRRAQEAELAVSSDTDAVDFVEQSQPAPDPDSNSQIRITEVSSVVINTDNDSRNEQGFLAESDPGVILHAAKSLSVKGDESGVPETSSDARFGANRSMHGPNSTGDPVNTDNVTNYDTAQTQQSHVEPLRSQMSSQPILKTPPGRRRKRMMDISAESSPLTTTPNFNIERVLQLDEDHQMAGFLEPSPQRRITYGHKHKRIDFSPAQVRHIDEDPNKNKISAPIAVSERPAATESSMKSPELSDLSQEIIQPTRQGRLGRAAIDRSEATPLPPFRRSVWDIEASPAKPIGVGVGRTKKVSQKKGKEQLEVEERSKDVTATPTPRMESTPVGEETSGSLVLGVSASFDSPHMSVDNVVAPNMVFACFNGKVRAYYPAVCLGLAGSDTTRYLIQWEGYAPDEVDAYGVKALNLQVGDAVKINLDKFPKVPYIIRGFKDKIEVASETITDIRGYRTLIVAPKQRKSLPASIITESCNEVPISSIYLDTNMWQQLKSRKFNFIPHPKSKQPEYVTPMPRRSTPSTPSSRARRHVHTNTEILIGPDGIFANMAFAISYENDERKNVLVDLVQSNGGLVLTESFHDLLEPENLQLKSDFATLGFTALLTERHSRKEKYMQALALGLPCLSGRWIETCIKNNSVLGWQAYLLPAGESAELDGATRSRTLSSMDPSSTKLSHMIDLRLDMLNDATVVVVMGRGKAEVKRTPYLFLIRALGAGRVHKAVDVKAAKEIVDSDKSCEWVFVDDRDLDSTRTLIDSNTARVRNQSKQCKVAGNELIVQSLILGRLYDG